MQVRADDYLAVLPYWLALRDRLMSLSGKGQTIVRQAEDIERAWWRHKHAVVARCDVIVERFIPFDEITLLTIVMLAYNILCADRSSANQW